MATDFEDILTQIGPFGYFQILLSTVVHLTNAPASWGMLIMTIAGATPDWWCPHGNPETTATTSGTTSHYIATTIDTNSTLEPKIQYCPKTGDICPNITYSTDFTSIVSEWNLICSNSWASGIITTIQMAGVLVGAATAGHLGDLIGRKKTLFIVYIFLLVTNLITAFSVSVEMYTALRFFVGVATGGLLVTGFVLPVEYIGKKYRTFSNMVPTWSIGTMIMAGLAFLISDWRKLAITVTCLGVPFLLFWWFIPESSLWLLARGRFDEAEETLVRIAKFNKKPEPSIEQLKNLKNNVLQELEERKKENNYSVIDLFRTWKYAKRTLLLFVLWFTCGLIYYGLSFGVKNLAGDRYVNIVLMAAVELPSFFALVINYKFGRRYTILLFFALGAVSSLSIPVMEWTGNYENNSDVVSALALTSKTFISCSWKVVMIFTAEQYPTVVRNLGYGVCNTGARVGAMISPLLIELHNISPYIPYLVFGSCMIIAAVCTLLLHETKDQNMPDYLPQRKQKNSEKSENNTMLKLHASDASLAVSTITVSEYM